MSRRIVPILAGREECFAVVVKVVSRARRPKRLCTVSGSRVPAAAGM